MTKRTRVLIITGDRVGRSMAGPAIRAWNMALFLARFYEVRLLSVLPVASDPPPAPFEFAALQSKSEMAGHEQWAEVIIFQGHILSQFPALKKTRRLLIADMYDPMHLEQLEQAKNLPLKAWQAQVESSASAMEQQMLAADFFVCASERQRQFYLGQLMSYGRILVEYYEADPNLRNLIDLVPFGMSEQPPVKTRPALRGVVPGIGPEDKVLIWGGGLYNWFDPKTLIEAVARLSRRRPQVRLFFQGTKHPNPAVPEMEIVTQSRQLAEELGVLSRQVFFNDEWVDYEDRQNYLLEADAGVSTHFDHVETTFSFRTRILDYLWAELPMVVTTGDVFADQVSEHGLGLVVPEKDVAALTEALERVLFDKKLAAQCRENIRQFRQNFFWPQVLKPLVRVIDNPPPVCGDRSQSYKRLEKRRIDNMPWGIRRNLVLVWYYLRVGGPKMVVEKIRTKIAFLREQK